MAGDLQLKRVIHIIILGGLVEDVENLPDGWTYEVEDLDLCSACGGLDPCCDCGFAEGTCPNEEEE